MYVGKEGFRGLLEKYTISPWNFQLSLTGHTDTVTAILVRDERLFSSDIDGNVFAWNKDTGEMLLRFVGFPGSIYAMALMDDGLFAGGSDRSIIMWNMNSGEVLKQFSREHMEVLLRMKVIDGKLFTGSLTGSVIKWNSSDFTPLLLQKRANSVRSIALWKNFLISGGDDTVIRVYDSRLSNHLPVVTLAGNQEYVICLYIHENYLFSGGTDNLIMQWNLNNVTKMKIF